MSLTHIYQKGNTRVADTTGNRGTAGLFRWNTRQPRVTDHILRNGDAY